MIKQVLQQLTSSNDAIMEVKLKRADFLLTHRKSAPAPLPISAEPTTMTPPPTSPIVTKTEMIEEEDLPKPTTDDLEVKDHKNTFFVNQMDSPPQKRAKMNDDDVIEIKQAEDDEKPFEIEWAQSNGEQFLNERDRRLRARYGHVARGGSDDGQPQYQLHLKVDER